MAKKNGKLKADFVLGDIVDFKIQESFGLAIMPDWTTSPDYEGFAFRKIVSRAALKLKIAPCGSSEREKQENPAAGRRAAHGGEDDGIR